jgi:hypothetical protein
MQPRMVIERRAKAGDLMAFSAMSSTEAVQSRLTARSSDGCDLDAQLPAPLDVQPLLMGWGA